MDRPITARSEVEHHLLMGAAFAEFPQLVHMICSDAELFNILKGATNVHDIAAVMKGRPVYVDYLVTHPQFMGATFLFDVKFTRFISMLVAYPDLMDLWVNLVLTNGELAHEILKLSLAHPVIIHGFSFDDRFMRGFLKIANDRPEVARMFIRTSL